MAANGTVIYMVYEDEDGKSITQKFDEPKSNLTVSQVETVMNSAISTGVIRKNGADAVAIKDVYKVETTRNF